MKAYIKPILVLCVFYYLVNSELSSFGQVPSPIEIINPSQNQKLIIKDCTLIELPLLGGDIRAVDSINNLVKATGGLPKGINKFDGKKGTTVEVVDAGSIVEDPDCVYKIVNGKANEVIISKDDKARFLKVRLLGGKEKGKVGWVAKEYVGEINEGNFEVRLRAFIPCEVVTLSPISAPIIFPLPTKIGVDIPATNLRNPSLGGDNRGFSYEDGSHRAAQNIRGRIDVGSGNGGIPDIQTNWGVSHAFAPLQTEHVEGKPWWWFKLIKGMETPIFSQQLERKDSNNLAKLNYLDGGKVAKIRLYINGGVPLVDHAPTINLDLDVVIEKHPTEEGYLRWAITGTHDGFPSYEIYINKEPAYQQEAGATKGPIALFSKNQKDQPFKTILRQVQVAKTGKVKFLSNQPTNNINIQINSGPKGDK